MPYGTFSRQELKLYPYFADGYPIGHEWIPQDLAVGGDSNA